MTSNFTKVEPLEFEIKGSSPSSCINLMDTIHGQWNPIHVMILWGWYTWSTYYEESVIIYQETTYPLTLNGPRDHVVVATSCKYTYKLFMHVNVVFIIYKILSFCFENSYTKVMTLYGRSNHTYVTVDLGFNNFASWFLHKASL